MKPNERLQNRLILSLCQKSCCKNLTNIALITTVSEVDELEDPYFRTIRRGIQVEAEQSKVNLKKIIRLSETPLEQDDLLKCQGVLIIGQVLSSVIEEVSAINSNVVVIDDGSVAKF